MAKIDGRTLDHTTNEHLREQAVKKPLKQNESLKERVKETLAAIKAMPKLIKSFFCAPSVAYAKD